MLQKIKNKIRIDFSKNTKLLFYARGLWILISPRFLYNLNLNNRFDKFSIDEKNEIKRRLEYYNKLSERFVLEDKFYNISEFIINEKKKTYFFDLLEYLNYFNFKMKISYLFGDITYVPDAPSFVKSRPIIENNQNSIVMKLNKVRHFIFVSDELNFEDKIDKAVWRGKVGLNRLGFIQKYYDNEFCNIGQTNTKGDLDVPWQKKKLSLKAQMEYKFIVAIEGNDVASNLKWAMSSNSLVMMSKPKYETWFMEGTLVEDFHYVLLKDDYSDLQEKIKYYILHTDEAKNIISNAHKHVEQFLNKDKEDFISLLVVEKFFYDTCQLKSKQLDFYE